MQQGEGQDRAEPPGRKVYVKGEMLQMARVSKGWSIEKLREKMGYDQVSPTTIKKLEKGGPCFPGTVERVCEALTISPAEVILVKKRSLNIDNVNTRDLLQIKVNFPIGKNTSEVVKSVMTILRTFNALLPENEHIYVSSVKHSTPDAELAAKEARQMVQGGGEDDDDESSGEGKQIRQQQNSQTSQTQLPNVADLFCYRLVGLPESESTMEMYIVMPKSDTKREILRGLHAIQIDDGEFSMEQTKYKSYYYDDFFYQRFRTKMFY